jgi:hypothetical protein
MGALTEIVWSFKVSFFVFLCAIYYDTDGLVQLQVIFNVSCIS